MDDALTLLGKVGSTIYYAFAWPGEYAILQLSRLMPDVAAYMSTPSNHTTAVVILSLVYWYLLIVLVTIVARTFRYVLRIVMATIHSIVFRITLEIGSAKTRLVCKLRQRLPWQRSRQDEEAPMVEFNKLDIAILKFAVGKGHGFALSAPEVAEQYGVRPAQAQRSLDKLCANAMLATVIGETDGFDNYRLTDSGFAYMAIWQRQHARTNNALGATPA